MKNTILLVDDNPNNLAVLYDALDEQGYRVLVTDNGIDAIERVTETSPDLILLDIRMPGLDGYETCRAIKANPLAASIPIIFLSTLTDTDDRLKGFEAGAVDYVTKPINPLEVIARVQTHVALSNLQKQLAAHNEQLEATVNQRTRDLQVEVRERRRQQAEKERLLELLREQNQELQAMVVQILQAQPLINLELASVFTTQLFENLTRVEDDLNIMALEMTKSRRSEQHLTTSLAMARQRLGFVKEHLQQTLGESQSAVSDQNTLPATTLIGDLTTRELEVIRLLCDGASIAEIAAELNISEVTVRTYRGRAMQKAGVSNFAGLVKFALTHNLTTLDY
ncbi:MAG: response regulator [Chloroflexota bacterium]